MIEGISNGSSLARAALEAALRSQQSAAAKVETQVAQTQVAQTQVAQTLGPGAAPAAFEGRLTDAVQGGLRAVDAELSASGRLPLEMVSGNVSDFHEVAAQLKRAELTFKFALEVRNKLIDAYRETMRMSV